MSSGNPALARILAARNALLSAGVARTEMSPRAQAALAQAVGSEKAAALAAGEDISKEGRAIRNREDVARMSLAGATVAEIAAALQLSYSHVVALRARLGVGRCR